MVDTSLDQLSDNGTALNITFSTNQVFNTPGFQALKRIVKTPPNCCIYHLGFTAVWLCNVTKFVFVSLFPRQIHFKLVC